jgi:hypothetical protein
MSALFGRAKRENQWTPKVIHNGRNVCGDFFEAIKAQLD